MPSSSQQHDSVLSALYVVMVCLCICMVVYTLVAPTPWILERSEFHRETVLPFLEENGVFRVASKHLITMYDGQPLVQATHIVPPALWAAILPFLLHPTWNDNHPEVSTGLTIVHARMALVTAFANFWIVHKDLTFEQFFPDVPLMGHGISPLIAVPLSLIQTVWFVMTLGESLRMAYLARSDPSAVKPQQKWMLRHAASGLTMMTQYFVVYPAYIAYYEYTIPRPEQIPSWIQRKAFADSAVLAALLCFCVGELAVNRHQGGGRAPSRRCTACGFDSQFVSEGMVECKHCDKVCYCSKDCQDWHWSKHKAACEGCPHGEDEATTEPVDDDSIGVIDAATPEFKRTIPTLFDSGKHLSLI